MSAALRSVGLLDVLSSTPAEPSLALAAERQMRLASTPGIGFFPSIPKFPCLL